MERLIINCQVDKKDSAVVTSVGKSLSKNPETLELTVSESGNFASIRVGKDDAVKLIDHLIKAFSL